MIGPDGEYNKDQCTVLFNDKTKEYMIMYSDFLDSDFGDGTFKHISNKELILQIEQLKEKGYAALSCSDELNVSHILGDH